MRPFAVALTVALLSGAARADAQSGPLLETEHVAPPVAAGTPAELVATVLERFTFGSAAAFDSVMPDPDARQLVAWAIEAGWPREAAGGGVVEADGDSAVVWLAGFAETGHSGYETSLGRMFTGLYAAVRDTTGWRLDRKLELDRGNRIRSHAIVADLLPGEGLLVRDTLAVETGPHGGFWATLNRVAQLDSVLVEGTPARYRHDAGLLWVDLAPARQLSVVLVYSLDVARDSARNGYFARFEPDFGHVRNQHYWHPFFGFGNERGTSQFRLLLHAPADVHVATDLPQTDTVIHGRRVIVARTSRPTAALTLMYDRRWTPVDRTIGTLRVRLAVDDSVRPSRQAIEAGLARVHRVLSRRFGEPRSPYLVVAQGRGQQGYGWIFRSNDMLAGGPVGGELLRNGALPRAFFGHEAAHGWTSPAGPGSIWLSEGWAMYAESLLLEDEFGGEAAANFWEAMRVDYLLRYDGTQSLADDAVNSGVSYPKGAWVLRMLEEYVGREAFEAGMRAWMSLPSDTAATVGAFEAAMSHAAGRDVGPFLRPWLEATTIPDLEARVEGDRVIVTQRGPLFVLDLDLDLVTADDTVRRRLHLSRAADTLDVGELGAVTDVHLDPEHRLLIHRHRGDTVRVELHAPDATRVELGGNVAAARIPAVRGDDGTWRVELVLAAGRYAHYWVVDGERREPAGGSLLVVRPVHRVD